MANKDEDKPEPTEPAPETNYGFKYDPFFWPPKRTSDSWDPFTSQPKPKSSGS